MSQNPPRSWTIHSGPSEQLFVHQRCTFTLHDETTDEMMMVSIALTRVVRRLLIPASFAFAGQTIIDGKNVSVLGIYATGTKIGHLHVHNPALES